MPSTTSLNEVVLAIHFENPISLTVLDLSSWSDAFADFTAFQELPPIPRTELLPQPPTFHMQFAPELPRIIKRAGPRPDMWVQLQADRFAIGWNRLAPLGQRDEYPGYPQMWAHWSSLAKRFYDWHQVRIGGTPASRLIEIGYSNAQLARRNGVSLRISDVLKNYRPSEPSRKLIGFNLSWAEALDSNPAEAQVKAFFNVGQLSTGEPAFLYNFLGLAHFDGDPLTEAGKDKLDQLHQRIIDMFDAAIISDTGNA